jgi:hypothetical protein
MLRKSQRQQRERQQGGQCGLQLGGRRTKKQQGVKRRHGKKHGKRSRRHSKKQRGGESEADEDIPKSNNMKNANAIPEKAEEAEAAEEADDTISKGGRRKRHTKKHGKKHGMKSKGASDWNKKVMVMYHKMKKDNPATKLGDAMRRCSALKKQGKL